MYLVTILERLPRRQFIKLLNKVDKSLWSRWTKTVYLLSSDDVLLNVALFRWKKRYGEDVVKVVITDGVPVTSSYLEERYDELKK